jgi:hypothetical protein
LPIGKQYIPLIRSPFNQGSPNTARRPSHTGSSASSVDLGRHWVLRKEDSTSLRRYLDATHTESSSHAAEATARQQRDAELAQIRLARSSNHALRTNPALSTIREESASWSVPYLVEEPPTPSRSASPVAPDHFDGNHLRVIHRPSIQIDHTPEPVRRSPFDFPVSRPVEQDIKPQIPEATHARQAFQSASQTDERGSTHESRELSRYGSQSLQRLQTQTVTVSEEHTHRTTFTVPANEFSRLQINRSNSSAWNRMYWDDDQESHFF